MVDSVLFQHTAGSTCYALLFNHTAQVWNGSGFVTYTTANLGSYDVAATELGSGSGIYAIAVPAVPAGVYGLIACAQGGASPAESDARVAIGSFSWDGSALVAAGQLGPEPAISGTVDDSSPDADSFAGDASFSSSDDFYVGSVLAFSSGSLKGLARRISSYVGSTRTITVSPAFPAAPADEDAFIIVGRID